MCHQHHDDVNKRHFHCTICRKIIKRKENLRNHVKTCTHTPDYVPKKSSLSNNSVDNEGITDKQTKHTEHYNDKVDVGNR